MVGVASLAEGQHSKSLVWWDLLQHPVAQELGCVLLVAFSLHLVSET